MDNGKHWFNNGSKPTNGSVALTFPIPELKTDGLWDYRLTPSITQDNYTFTITDVDASEMNILWNV
jgi:hypothetical protein